MSDELAACYALLEVDRAATAGEIRESYLDLVKVWHPDRFQESPRLRRKAEEKLKAVNEAYERLRSGAPVFESRPADAPRPAASALNPDLKPADFGGVWGYVDSSGRLIVPPRFRCALAFSEGLAAARQEERFGFIDASGEFAIYPEFQCAGSFAEGLAPVVLSSLWGYIDRCGGFRINPLFEDCRGFREGLAAVYWRGRWGYIDRQGRFAIHPRFEGAMDFRDGWGEVKVGQKWTRISREGEVYYRGEAAGIGAGYAAPADDCGQT